MRHSGAQFTAALLTLALYGWTQTAPAAEPYKVVNTAKVGGAGGFDYVFADVDGRRLFIPRSSRVTVFDLDTLKSLGEIPNTNGVHGVAVDPKSNHGFTSSKPVVMFDTFVRAVQAANLCSQPSRAERDRDQRSGRLRGRHNRLGRRA
jgi:hypothetical protein